MFFDQNAAQHRDHHSYCSGSGPAVSPGSAANSVWPGLVTACCVPIRASFASFTDGKTISITEPLDSGNNNVTIIKTLELRGYIDEHGTKRFAKWFASLDAIAAAKVAIALTRLERGNLSNAKGVGGGVLEYKIDFGPGYRIYFGKDGERLVILIGGGTKKRQHRDIAAAPECWIDYKRRKKHAPYP